MREWPPWVKGSQQELKVDGSPDDRKAAAILEKRGRDCLPLSVE
jgi:hypothetical protein